MTARIGSEKRPSPSGLPAQTAAVRICRFITLGMMPTEYGALEFVGIVGVELSHVKGWWVKMITGAIGVGPSVACKRFESARRHNARDHQARKEKLCTNQKTTISFTQLSRLANNRWGLAIGLAHGTDFQPCL